MHKLITPILMIAVLAACTGTKSDAMQGHGIKSDSLIRPTYIYYKEQMDGKASVLQSEILKRRISCANCQTISFLGLILRGMVLRHIIME